MSDTHPSNAARSWRWGAWAAVLFISAGLAAGTPARAEEPVITAVFKAKEVSFQYRGARRYFTCEELENRVARILMSVGARDNIKVNARNCDGISFNESDSAFDDPFGNERENSPFGRQRPTDRFRSDSSARSMTIQIELQMPIEITPKILAEIEKDRSRRELISRVNKNPSAAFNDPITFAAQRQQVKLSSERPLALKAEDCELLDQMAMHVFRQLDIKIVRRGFACGRGEPSRVPPQIVVEALMPTGELRPMPEAEKEKKKPAGGSSEPAEETEEPENNAKPPEKPGE